MKLNPNTLKVLKNFARISPHFSFKKGNKISTWSKTKQILAIATLDQELDQEFAVHDLSRFLSALSLIDGEPEIIKGGNVVKIGDGVKFVDYTPSDPGMLLIPPDREPRFSNEGVILISVSDDNIKSVLKTADVLSLRDIIIEGKDGQISLSSTNLDNPSSDEGGVSLSSSNEKEFKAIFSREDMIFLPGNYKVEISDKRIAKWVGDNIEYYVAMDSRSEV